MLKKYVTQSGRNKIKCGTYSTTFSFLSSSSGLILALCRSRCLNTSSGSLDSNLHGWLSTRLISVHLYNTSLSGCFSFQCARLPMWSGKLSPHSEQVFNANGTIFLRPLLLFGPLPCFFGRWSNASSSLSKKGSNGVPSGLYFRRCLSPSPPWFAPFLRLLRSFRS